MLQISLIVPIITVDIGAVTILPSGPIIETSQKPFHLNCSFDLSSNSLPQNVSAPNLVWLFNSTNTSLPHGAIMSNMSNMSDMSSGSITYTRTLFFSPLLESHMGTYTCQIEGNKRQSANTSIFICT